MTGATVLDQHFLVSKGHDEAGHAVRGSVA